MVERHFGHPDSPPASITKTAIYVPQVLQQLAFCGKRPQTLFLLHPPGSAQLLLDHLPAAGTNSPRQLLYLGTCVRDFSFCYEFCTLKFTQVQRKRQHWSHWQRHLLATEQRHLRRPLAPLGVAGLEHLLTDPGLLTW